MPLTNDDFVLKSGHLFCNSRYVDKADQQHTERPLDLSESDEEDDPEIAERYVFKCCLLCIVLDMPAIDRPLCVYIHAGD